MLRIPAVYSTAFSGLEDKVLHSKHFSFHS